MKRTKHFEQRIRQRSISELEIDYVRMHGENYANGRIVLSRKKAEKLMQEIEREYRKKKELSGRNLQEERYPRSRGKQHPNYCISAS